METHSLKFVSCVPSFYSLHFIFLLLLPWGSQTSWPGHCSFLRALWGPSPTFPNCEGPGTNLGKLKLLQPCLSWKHHICPLCSLTCQFYWNLLRIQTGTWPFCVQISWENRWIETNPFDIGFIVKENSDCLLCPALEPSCSMFYAPAMWPQGH